MKPGSAARARSAGRSPSPSRRTGAPAARGRSFAVDTPGTPEPGSDLPSWRWVRVNAALARVRAPAFARWPGERTDPIRDRSRARGWGRRVAARRLAEGTDHRARFLGGLRAGAPLATPRRPPADP